MLYLIGLGLCDENDITLKGLECIKKSEIVYLEHYTSILHVEPHILENKFDCKVILCDRDMIEKGYGEILQKAALTNVSLLVVGDPFGATTHSDLLLKCKNADVELEVIHNASIINAVAISGLQLYRFGQTVSIPFFTERWKPDSFYDRIKDNDRLNLHTLCLLDIKMKEISEENLFKGKNIFERPKFMEIGDAINQFEEIEKQKKEGILDSSRWIVGLARVGSRSQKIVYGKMKDLRYFDFGIPLHSIIIPAPQLHEVEKKVLETIYTHE